MNSQQLIPLGTVLSDAWSLVMQHVQDAVSSEPQHRDHPFRYVSLATADALGAPRQRMVVLRELLSDREMLFYTDSRSDKAAEISSNGQVSLLFYDHARGLQLRAGGVATLLTDGDEHDQAWTSRGIRNPFSYTSILSPGTPVDQPHEAWSWYEEESFFALINVEIHLMEFLQLDGFRHRRSERSWHAGRESMRWIAP